MYFKKLELKHWQQFEEVDMDLHDRITIVTGSNGCGKTTVLNLFARHAGWNKPSLSTPKQDKGTGVINFFTRLFNGADKSSINKVGSIGYSNNVNSDLLIPNSNSAQYQIQPQSQQPVKCFFYTFS